VPFEPRWTQAAINELRAAIQNGLEPTAIAEVLRRSEADVRRMIGRVGVRAPVVF
jgi:chaperonin GroEL (HSP60 family)